jgi:hypothetical protein
VAFLHPATVLSLFSVSVSSLRTLTPICTSNESISLTSLWWRKDDERKWLETLNETKNILIKDHDAR